MTQTDGVFVLFCVCPSVAIFLAWWIAVRYRKDERKRYQQNRHFRNSENGTKVQYHCSYF